MVKVHRYRRYDTASDDYLNSTRMATLEQIERIGAEPVPGTEADVDPKFLTDGWTAKDFNPEWQELTPEEIARERARLQPRVHPDT